MSKARSAQVHLTGPGKGTVTVSGAELHGVRAVTVEGAVGEVTRLTVELALFEAEIDGEMVVTVPPKTAATLAALGWTPPAGQPLDTPDLPHAYRHDCGQLVEGAPGDDRYRRCPHCRWDFKPEEAGPRYVLVQIGGAPDAAAG